MIYADTRDAKKAPLNAHGFTIVELIVVIIVIAILAAITVVSYSAISTSARQKGVEADARGTAAALAKYKAENGGYPSDLNNVDVSTEFKSSYQYSYNPTTRSYCLTASTTGASAYVVSGNSATNKGGCPGHGVNGQAPITNLATNPGVRTGTTGWTVGAAGSTGTSARVATGGPSGVIDTYFRYSTTAAATASPISISATPSGTGGIPVQGSKTYNISLYVRSSCVLSAGIRIDYANYNSAGTYITTTTGVLLKNTANTWHRLTRSITTTSDTAFARILASYSGPGACSATSTFDATALMFTEGDVDYQYADGSSTNWIWNGAANASASTGPGTQ